MSRSSATQSAAKLSAAESASEGVSDLGSARNMWQHPFVDVFKQFKIMPNQDWKLNKKQGDVSEQFVSEIQTKLFRQRKSAAKSLCSAGKFQPTTLFKFLRRLVP